MREKSREIERPMRGSTEEGEGKKKGRRRRRGQAEVGELGRKRWKTSF